MRGEQRERDREVENVNYINILLRREKVDKHLRLLQDTTLKYGNTGKQPGTLS